MEPPIAVPVPEKSARTHVRDYAAVAAEFWKRFDAGEFTNAAPK
jgi:hypothetical protein